MGMDRRTLLLVIGVDWVDEAVGVCRRELVLEIQRVVLLGPVTGMYRCCVIQSEKKVLNTIDKT